MSMMDVSIIDMQGSAILPPEQLEAQKIIASLAKEREQSCQKTTRLQEQLQEIIRKKLESRNGVSSDQKQSGLAL
jgi:hypothetical protein